MKLINVCLFVFPMALSATAFSAVQYTCTFPNGQSVVLFEGETVLKESKLIQLPAGSLKITPPGEGDQIPLFSLAVENKQTCAKNLDVQSFDSPKKGPGFPMLSGGAGGCGKDELELAVFSPTANYRLTFDLNNTNVQVTCSLNE